MDTLLQKLTSLSYELFGVVLPGLVLSAFLMVLWFSLGSLVSAWTSGSIPPFPPEVLVKLSRQVPGAVPASALFSLILIWYFLGHWVNWLSKGRSRSATFSSRLVTRCQRIWKFLRFRVTRPDSYHQSLQRRFEEVSKKLSHDGQVMEWREFYPIAKAFLSSHRSHSLVATYQNKYTLHRAIAAAAAILFWLSIVANIAALSSVYCGLPGQPVWLILAALPVFAFLLVGGFSATYEYAWSLWGDSLITESYAELFDPK